MNGLFIQDRVGRKAKLFKILKIRTLNKHGNASSFGKFLRKSKLDELPQLINILINDMSFVGPRPDLPGFADRLSGDDRIILSIKPGITGPAALKFFHEEEVLKSKSNPDKYSREVIWPEKIKLNKEYIENYHILLDIKYILKTIVSIF